MTLRTVLLVDDDPDLRMIGELALRQVGGLAVTVAASGAEALALAAAAPPDVILLDVQMPGLDGPATLAQLRADPRTAAIPVVFLTAGGRGAALADADVHGLIRKPFDPMTLADQLRALMAG